MKLLKAIRSFFLRLTPAGRKNLMFTKVLDNIEEKKALSHLEKRELQSQINFYLNKILKSNKIKSGHHIEILLMKKFGEQISSAGLKMNRFNYKLENA